MRRVITVIFVLLMWSLPGAEAWLRRRRRWVASAERSAMGKERWSMAP